MAEKIPPPDKKGDTTKPPTALELAFQNAKKGKEAAEAALGEQIGLDVLNRLSNPESIVKPLPSAIPPELAQIYGEKVPAAVLEMYGKLKGKGKREGYLAKLASDEAEKKKKAEARQSKTKSRTQRPKPKQETKPKIEQPIAPLTPMPPEFEERKPEADFIAQQLAAIAAQKPTAEEKAPESFPEPSVDDSHIHALQYKASPDMQADMDSLSKSELVEPPPAISRSDRGRKKITESEPILSEEVAAPLAGAPEWAEPTLDFDKLPNVSEEKMTPAESYSLLGKLIDGYKKTLASAKEKIGTATEKAKEYITSRNEQLRNTISGWVTESKETVRIKKEKAAALGKYLADRDISLGEKAKTLGRGAGENFMRTSEWYRNLPLRDKVGISAVFILGSVATGGAGTFVTLLGAAKLGQRSLASAGVYTLAEGLMEKRISKKEAGGAVRTKWDTWKKHGTATAASLAVFSGIPGYALKEMFDAAGGERAIELIGGMLGHQSLHAPVVEEAPPQWPPEGHPLSDTAPIRPPQPAAAPGPAPTAAPDFQPQASASIENPAAAAAAGPEAAAPNTVPTPAAGLSSAEAPANVPQAAVDTTPAAGKLELPTDVVEVNMPTHEEVIAHMQSQAEQELTSLQSAEAAPVDGGAGEASESAEFASRSWGAEAPAQEEVSLEHETITTTEPMPGPDLTAEQDLASQQAAEAAPVVDETQPPVPVVERGFVSNTFGLQIPVGEPHIYYADPGDAHTLVFGGSVAEQAKVIEEHLLANPDSVVYGTDNSKTYLIPYHLVEGKMEAGPPMRTSGVFGFFSNWMKAPGPEDLAKLIK